MATKKTATASKTTKAAKEKDATTTTKKVAAKKTVAKKEESAKKTDIKKTATKKPEAKKAPAKKVAAKKRAKKQEVVLGPPPKLDIVDAIRTKPRKNVSKPGQVIAMRPKDKPQEEDLNLTMEEYKPVQKSLLDDKEETSGPVYRYSDEDLNEFKELIQSRIEKAKSELVYLQGLITRKDEAGTSDTDNRFNHMEDGSGAMEREQVSQLAGRQVQFISHLENALIRIENKTYGICRVTGQLISKDRLRAVPHATLSIEAKNEMNK